MFVSDNTYKQVTIYTLNVFLVKDIQQYFNEHNIYYKIHYREYYSIVAYIKTASLEEFKSEYVNIEANAEIKYNRLQYAKDILFTFFDITHIHLTPVISLECIINRNNYPVVAINIRVNEDGSLNWDNVRNTINNYSYASILAELTHVNSKSNPLSEDELKMTAADIMNILSSCYQRVLELCG